MKYPFIVVLLCCFNLISCAVSHDNATLKGQWITEPSGLVMLDPQTSGLTFWRGKLLSISDGSADLSQQKKLHIIDPSTGVLAKNSLIMKMSARVQNSCFAAYLEGEPDLEALTVDPNNDNVFIAVTEDARRGEGLSSECQKRFAHSGSTDFPSVLIRLELINANTVLITHAKPIKFGDSYQIGNFPNDGIEGLALGENNTLYLALEKDSKGVARIFTIELTSDFWQSDAFTHVKDTLVELPRFETEHHPINGLTYVPIDNHKGYLIAAARNDNQLWVIDLANKKSTKKINLTFWAPTLNSNITCDEWELIGNTSIEGIAFHNDRLWLVNDPWKEHYSDNIKCDVNRVNYERFAPLLFSLPVHKSWFE